MSHFRRGIAAAALLAASAAFALAGDVVVLKGGETISLKQPPVRRGNTVYLTRTDGTMLSVPSNEIDRDATAAARAAAAAPAPAPAVPAAAPSTPADAARSAKDGPKARVRITDADVSHPLELPDAAGDKGDKKEAAPGSVRVEIAEYNQQKEGDALIVTGQLRNPTQQVAEGVKLTVTALDEKGQSIDSTAASLSRGTIDSGMSVNFTAKITVGEKIVASLRFAPQWAAPKPTPVPVPAAARNGGNASNASAANRPVPTPYGRGSTTAYPVASAPLEAPPDGQGYIPGISSPDNQPRPPVP